MTNLLHSSAFHTTHRRRLLTLASAMLLAASPTRAQSPAETVDLNAVSRIRDMALNHSQIADTVGYLSDVIGPRLTGSPNLKKALRHLKDQAKDLLKAGDAGSLTAAQFKIARLYGLRTGRSSKPTWIHSKNSANSSTPSLPTTCSASRLSCTATHHRNPPPLASTK